MTPYLSRFWAGFTCRCDCSKNMTPYLSRFNDTVPVIFFNLFFCLVFFVRDLSPTVIFFNSFALNSVWCCAGAPLPLSFLSSFRLVFIFFWSVLTSIRLLFRMFHLRWSVFMCCCDVLQRLLPLQRRLMGLKGKEKKKRNLGLKTESEKSKACFHLQVSLLFS